MDSENRKFTVLAFLTIGALVGLVAHKVLGLTADIFRFGTSNVFGLGISWTVLGTSVAGAIGFIVFLALILNSTATVFFDECFGELKRVTWPNTKETSAAAIVVSIMVVCAAVIFLLIDMVWGMMFTWIL